MTECIILVCIIIINISSWIPCIIKPIDSWSFYIKLDIHGHYIY